MPSFPLLAFVFFAILFPFNLSAAVVAEPAKKLPVYVYGSRFLDEDAVIQMTGLDSDPDLPLEEVKRRLQTTSLFREIAVWKTEDAIHVLAREKTNWFVLPYLSSNSSTTIYGLAFGKAAMYGQDAEFIGRGQMGSENREASLLLRDFSYRDTPWTLGMSLDYEDSRLQEYRGRDVVRRTDNWFFGGSLRAGYRFTPHLTISLSNYLERHRVENIDGTRAEGFQGSHKWMAENSNFYLQEGLTRGGRAFLTFEHTSRVSDFRFAKLGAGFDRSVFLRRDFNWIAYGRFGRGWDLPRYQQFRLGGASLRGFPGEQFHATHFYLLQNDVYLDAWDLWKLKLRPLAFADFAYVNQGGRTGLGLGLRVFFQTVAVPALQIAAGYGFHPNGFAVVATIGPEI